jgi:hypothetical protein
MASTMSSYPIYLDNFGKGLEWVIIEASSSQTWTYFPHVRYLRFDSCNSFPRLMPSLENVKALVLHNY